MSKHTDTMTKKAKTTKQAINHIKHLNIRHKTCNQILMFMFNVIVVSHYVNYVIKTSKM